MRLETDIKTMEFAREEITSNIILPGRIATDRSGFIERKIAERVGCDVKEIRREVPIRSPWHAMANHKNTQSQSPFWRVGERPA
jgi:NAD(P)-dependent dehydrogenase (short-subunit alcohol dehydrogenase family)